MTPGEKYDVRVLSGTKAGWPVLTEEQQLWWSIEMPQANDTVPLAPDVEIRELNSTAIKARWTMSRKNKIQPGSFRVSLMKNEALFQGPFDVDSATSTYTFNNLGMPSNILLQILSKIFNSKTVLFKGRTN